MDGWMQLFNTLLGSVEKASGDIHKICIYSQSQLSLQVIQWLKKGVSTDKYDVESR